MKKPKKNSIVIIKVNGVQYNTEIDSNGIQRFITNSLIRNLVDSKQVDLNNLVWVQCIALEMLRNLSQNPKQNYTLNFKLCPVTQNKHLKMILLEIGMDLGALGLQILILLKK